LGTLFSSVPCDNLPGQIRQKKAPASTRFNLEFLIAVANEKVMFKVVNCSRIGSRARKKFKKIIDYEI
jgi:hypothetical protein